MGTFKCQQKRLPNKIKLNADFRKKHTNIQMFGMYFLPCFTIRISPNKASIFKLQILCTYPGKEDMAKYEQYLATPCIPL